jgi:hypothetical protein
MRTSRIINRRNLLIESGAGVAAIGTTALMMDQGKSASATYTGPTGCKAAPIHTKRIFFSKGSCASALCHIVGCGLGCPKQTAGSAADPLAGGIMQKGHQCGMLWGSAAAVGAEAFNRYKDRKLAVAKAVTAAQLIVDSFLQHAPSVNCRDITKVDWSNKIGFVKYFITGKIFTCLNIAEKWGPEAIKAAINGLSQEQTALPQQPLSCASEVAKKMGASDEEMITVAGFAGGIGLSGNACGALGAAIWMKAIDWCKKHPGKAPSIFNNPEATKTIKAFENATRSEFLCKKITGARFTSINDHTEFIKNGGCKNLINVLAQS